MPRRKNLTEIEKVAILAAVRDGQQRTAIAEQFGIERKALDNFVRRYDAARGIEHHSHTHKLSAEVRQLIVTEYRNGTPSAQVAIMYNVSQGYVTTLARSHHDATADSRQRIEVDTILDTLPTSFAALLAAANKKSD